MFLGLVFLLGVLCVCFNLAHSHHYWVFQHVVPYFTLSLTVTIVMMSATWEEKNHLGSWISLFFFAPVDFRLDFGFLSLDFGVWVLEFGFLDFGFGFWILEFGFWTVDSWILDLDCLPRFGLCIKYFQVTPTWVD